MIVILTKDLMMSSSAGAAAKSLGLTLKSVPSVDQALEVANGGGCRLLLIDLQMPSLDVNQLSDDIGAIEPRCRPHSVAYAQHVNVQTIKDAKALDFDEVTTRGQIHSGLADLMSRYAS